MITISQSLEEILSDHKKSRKPLAVVLAGHNGSGKTTFWYDHVVNRFQIPLLNADRIFMSILPEAVAGEKLPSWASDIRDKNRSWMKVAQKSVESFVSHAMEHKVPFAVETVFSHWKKMKDGRIESKIDLIKQMQDAGYYVLLLFVGLTSYQLSMGRVSTRVANGGHWVAANKLRTRFPRTQKAIKQAVSVADSAILYDNSSEAKYAFTVCRIQIGYKEIFDCRNIEKQPTTILEWLNKVSPK